MHDTIFFFKNKFCNLKPQADRETDSQLEKIEINRGINYILQIKSTKIWFFFKTNTQTMFHPSFLQLVSESRKT